MSKFVPKLSTDEEAEAFLVQDLSNLDYSQFELMQRFVREAPEGQGKPESHKPPPIRHAGR